MVKKKSKKTLQVWKRTLTGMGFLAVSLWFLSGAVYGELVLPISTGKMSRPKPGMTADELMKIFFHVKYSKDSHDYTAQGGTQLISKAGLKRNRAFYRSRIILNSPEDNLDYKDIVTFTRPENVKGLSVLTWTYLTRGQDQDVWLWLPSLRKIRRIAQNEGDDSFMGTDFTYEEVVYRKWGDETYTLVGEENFPGHQSIQDGKTYYKDTPCYVIEARPKQKDWYYSKRRAYLEKDTAFRIHDTYFDQMGRSQKTLFVYWSPIEGSELDMEWLLEVAELRSNHSTIIDLEEVKFDQGLSEKLFTERALMRTKW
jgi:hypothetical protein